MPNKCCVPLCTSGYKTDLEKVPMYTAPTDDLTRKIWTRAIPRKNYVVTESSFVCAKHFTTDDIIHFEVKKGMNPRKKSTLKIGAVPTIFPGCPKRLTNEKKITCRGSAPLPLYNEWDLPTTKRPKKKKPEKNNSIPGSFPSEEDRNKADSIENQDIPESITDITNETVMDCEFSEEIAFEGCQATTEISVLYDGVPFGNVLEKESSDDYISDLEKQVVFKSNMDNIEENVMKGQSTDGTVARDQLAQNGTALEQSSLDKDLLMENRPISTTQMSSYLEETDMNKSNIRVNNEETVMECQHSEGVVVPDLSIQNDLTTWPPVCPESEAEPPSPSAANAPIVEAPPPLPPILVLPKGWIGPSEFGVFISLRYANGKYLNTEKALQLEGQNVHYFVLDRPYNNSGELRSSVNSVTELNEALYLFDRMIICPGFKKSEVLLSQKCKKGKLYSTESGDYWRSYNCSAISLPKSGPIHRSGSSCDSCYKFECHLRRRLTVNQRVGSYRIAFRKLFNAKRTILRRDKALKKLEEDIMHLRTTTKIQDKKKFEDYMETLGEKVVGQR